MHSGTVKQLFFIYFFLMKMAAAVINSLSRKQQRHPEYGANES